MLPLALVLTLAGPFGPSRGLQDPPTNAVLEQASPEARALWGRLCAASGSAERAPIAAFRLRADVLTRSGVQTNETHVDYRYLAPDCLRFMLPSKNETGRFGPAPEQYWLKSGKEVVTLAGREYKEDRRQVDDMLALAKNYVALSNPSRLNLAGIELLAAAPVDLGPEIARNARKLRWLALTSADFALVRREGAASAGTTYRVEVGLFPRDEDPGKAAPKGLDDADLPALVVIRESGHARGVDPLLVVLGDYREQDGFKVPRKLLVHVLDRALVPPAFAQRPSQEIYVTEAALKPELQVDDFKPEKPK